MCLLFHVKLTIYFGRERIIRHKPRELVRSSSSRLCKNEKSVKEWELKAWFFSLLFALHQFAEFSAIPCPNSRKKRAKQGWKTNKQTNKIRGTTKNIFYRFIYN